jgi:hypothetical protein
MRDKIGFFKKKNNIIQLLQGMPRSKVIIGILFILLTGFILHQSLIAIQMRKLKAMDFQFASQKKLLKFYDRIMKEEAIFQDEANNKEEVLAKVKESFIPEEELADYFNNLRALARLNNVEVASLELNPQELEVDSKEAKFVYFRKLSFDLSLKGDYFNIMYLLYKLEQNKPIYDIKSVRISQDNPPDSFVAANIKAAIYILQGKI